MKKIYLLINIVFFLISSSTSAEIVNKIIITGNDRISKETIILFGDIKKDTDINNVKLNNILKNLYDTNFFSNVQVNISNNVLNINVAENPIVQTILFNGIKAKRIKDVLLDSLVLKEKNSYVEFIVENDIIRIKNILKKSGYFFAEVNLSLQTNENKTVNLIYDIVLGDKALIKKIKFVGNKVFKDRKLRNIITTEENKFWKFISSNRYLDQSRIALDERLIKNFYLNKGYYNVKVYNTFSKMLDDKNFVITFNIDAGKKFRFKNVNLQLPSDYNRKNFADIEKKLSSLKNQVYSFREIEKVLDSVETLSLTKQFEFINATLTETIVDTDKLDFTISIIESLDKFYVEKINIKGNSITNENVIRNTILIDEGDPYNKILLNKSINRLKGRNLFKSVDKNVLDGNEEKKKILEIIVEEKATGEISAGAGIGTSGSSIVFGVKENNYLGKGIILNTKLMLDEESVRGNFNYNNPNYKNSDKGLMLNVGSSAVDRLTEYGYKSSSLNFLIGTNYEQFEDIYFSPQASVEYDKIETSNTASSSLKKQKGDYFDLNFSYSLDNDLRNQRYQATNGYRQVFTQEIPLISESYSLSNSYNIRKYLELIENNTTTISFTGKTITALANNKDVRISKRITMPSKQLRGFEPGKVGPTDGGDHIGGNFMTAFNINSDVPYLFKNLQNVDIKLFFDAANLWGVDYRDKNDDSSKLRTSTGLAIDWFTAVGPLNFSLSQPLTKKDTDKTESFRFSLGTTF